MESDSSLTLLNESSSFQVLDQSSSFMLLDALPAKEDFNEPEPIEYSNLDSHFDAEDEWLQLETGSVISSMSLILKPDGSIQSEYSLLDNLHASALNEGCKLIKTRPDIYVEDQTMRKILEYISMFSDEVTSCLKLSRSAQSLVSSQKIQEDWEISSLVDLDDISVEALGLLLDTLEEFGMYKLCLIVCNRYSLSNRIGRYIVGLASKYSFLNETQRVDLKGGAVVQKAAVAYTAVHNMLEMISPAYICIKEKDGKDLGVEAFQGLLLLGYWKKLVYIMDFDNSMAVTRSFGDFKNFKQAYLIRCKNSEYDLNKEDFLWTLEQDSLALKIALDSVVCNFQAFRGIGRNKAFLSYVKGEFPEFPECFRFNRMIWRFLMKETSCESFLKDFQEFLLSFCGFIKNPVNFNELYQHDCYSVFILIVLALEEGSLDCIKNLNFSDFERFLMITNHVCLLLNNRSSSMTSQVLSMMSPIGVRQIIQSEVTSVYPFSTHVLMHRSSVLISRSSTIPATTKVPDIEGHYYMIPISSLKSGLFEMIKGIFRQVLNRRVLHFLQNCENEVETRANLLGEIWNLEFISYQKDSSQYKLASFNYFKLDYKLMKEYTDLQNKYKDLIQLGETDYYSELYLRFTRGQELNKIEKRLRSIENKNHNKNNLLNETFVVKLAKEAEVNSTFTEVTRSTRQALITFAQNYMFNSLQATDTVAIKYLWTGYHLLKVINEVDIYLEFIRVSIKRSQNVRILQLGLGFADIDAYIKRNNYYEACKTILNIFENDFYMIDIELRASLLHKAVLFYVVSSQKHFEASSACKSVLPACHFSKGVHVIPLSFNKNLNPRLLMSYLLNIFRELALSDLTDEMKETIPESLYESAYLIMKYSGSNHELFALMRHSEHVIVIQALARIFPDKKFADFLNLTDKAWEEFQENYRIKEPEEFIVLEWAKEEEVYQKLDSDWNQEQKRIALKISAGLKVKKFIEKTVKKRKNEGNIFISSGKELMTAVQKFHMELNDLLYKSHLKKVLDYHHLFSRYSFISQMYKNSSINDKESTEKMLIEVKEEVDNFRAWLKAITPDIENPRKVHKKKYKMRWPMRFKYAKNKR